MIVPVSTHPRFRSLGAVAALVATALLAAGCGSDSTDAVATTDTVATTTAPEAVTTAGTTTAPGTTTADGSTTITVVVKNAAPDGGIEHATVAKGDTVSLVVHSDVDDEVHLHGYNLAADVAAGGVARIEFVASVPGRFEAELEQRGVQIADLTVTP